MDHRLYLSAIYPWVAQSDFNPNKGTQSQKRMQNFVLVKFENSMIFQDPYLNEIPCTDPVLKKL